MNLLEFMKEKKAIPRDKIFGESFAHDVVDVNNPEKTLLYRWCIKGKWKLLLSYDGEVGRYKASHKYEKSPQLFDLIKDPHEKNNLATGNPEVVDMLAKEIEAWYPLKRAKVLQ